MRREGEYGRLPRGIFSEEHELLNIVESAPQREESLHRSDK